MSATLEYTGTLVQQLADACLDFDAWQRVGQTLSHTDRHRQEFIGDWLNAGEERHGEKCYEAAERIFPQYKRKSFQNMASVCKAVPLPYRREELCYGHYAQVAKLPDTEKHAWLSRAVAEKLQVNELRVLINPKKETVCIPISQVTKGMFFVSEKSSRHLYYVTRIKRNGRPEIRWMHGSVATWWDANQKTGFAEIQGVTLVRPLTKAQVFEWNRVRFAKSLDLLTKDDMRQGENAQ